MSEAIESKGQLDHERLDAYTAAVELDAGLTLLLHRGACRGAERNAAKTLTVRVVAMLTGLRNRAVP